jgi:hypothetical protein
VFQHRAQPGWGGDDAWQVAEFAADPGELGVLLLGGSAAGAAAVVPVAVEVFDVVELGDGFLGGDFGGEPGRGRAGVAFEDRELGVLVLAGAGDDTEGLVCDVPGERATELPGVEGPRNTDAGGVGVAGGGVAGDERGRRLC